LDELLDEIYRSKTVRDAHGTEYPLEAHVHRADGEFLFDLIRSRREIVRTLEIGCAYGLSSLFIAKALKGREGAEHVIIDAFQGSAWKNVGFENLRRSGIDFFRLIEEPSEIALPRLVQERQESFDLVYIDGWHTFDQTLLDLFYANRLLRVGGYLVADDCNLPAVAKAMAYVASYPCYEMVGGVPLYPKPRLPDRLIAAIPEPLAGWIIPRRIYDYHRMGRRFSTIALQKTRPDERDEIWFESF
jgi:predicted O-methyltransferase YrrM